MGLSRTGTLSCGLVAAATLTGCLSPARHLPGEGTANLGIFIPVLLLPLSMWLFTRVAGGHGVLTAIQSRTEKTLAHVGRTLAIFSILFVCFGGLCIAHVEEFGALVAVALAVAAALRGVRLIRWGRQAQQANAAEHLRQARPLQLVGGGALLILVTAVLGPMAPAFVGYWTPKENARYVDKFVAYQIAYAKVMKEKTGEARYHSPQDEPKHAPPFGWPGDDAQVEYTKDGFVISTRSEANVWPNFPYSLMASETVYRADQSGKIQEARIHDAESWCPADAPVAREVDEDLIEDMEDEVRDQLEDLDERSEKTLGIPGPKKTSKDEKS